jgi:hypothetical protein
MYLVEVCACLRRSSVFSNFHEGCLNKKCDCWCANMIIFSVVTWDCELFSNDGLSPCLLGYQVWFSDQTMVWTREEMWLNSWQGQEILLFRIVSSLGLGPTQPPVQ